MLSNNVSSDKKNQKNQVFPKIVRKISNEAQKETSSVILPASNCHSRALTVRVGIGSPKKFFDVVIDTTSNDLWVPSSKCEKSCDLLGLNMYDPDTSSLAVPLSDDSKFESNIGLLSLEGSKLMDSVQIGSLLLEKQVFGSISSFPKSYYPICGSVDGVLGLGRPSSESHRWYDLVMDGIKKSFDYAIVSIYLNGNLDDFETRNRKLQKKDKNDVNTQKGNQKNDGEKINIYYEDDAYSGNTYVIDDLEDDYTLIEEKTQSFSDDTNISEEKSEIMNNDFDMKVYQDDDYQDEDMEDFNDVNEEEESILEEHQIMSRPVYAGSELILGGVNPYRYNGCIFWHPLSPLPSSSSSWSFQLDNFNNKIALIDTTTSTIHGPDKEVGEYLEAANAQCFTINKDNTLGPLISCSDTNGFHVAFADCSLASDEDFLLLNFIANHRTYSLGYDELIEIFITNQGEKVCQYRLVGDASLEHWILGTPFLHKYYVALDIKEEKIGLALANHITEVEASEDDLKNFCEADQPLFAMSLSTDEDHNSTVIEHTTPSIQSSEIEEIDNSLFDEYSPSYIIASSFFVVLLLIIGLAIRRKRISTKTELTTEEKFSFSSNTWEGYDEEHDLS